MKLHLLIMTSTFPRRDADTDPPFVFELCKHLHPDHPVTVLAPHAPGAAVSEDYHGIHVSRFRYFFESGEMLAYDGGMLNRLRTTPAAWFVLPFFLIAETFASARLLTSRRFSLVNAHWILPQGLCAVFARAALRSRIPIICTVHGGDIFALRGGSATALKRFVLRSCDAVIAVSRAVARQVCALGTPADKVHIIPMGVDLRSLFTPPHTPVRSKSILFVGRLVPKKGLRYLLEAMPHVISRHPDACLTIVGGGPEESLLRRLIAELRLHDHVRCTGPLPKEELPSLYRSAAIVVFPSIVTPSGDTEGFGLVMVEAMGCGCAVVASDLPAVHDIITDRLTGLLVEQQNPAAIAERIIYLLDNPDERIGLSTNARQFVLERYDWTITARNYSLLVHALCSPAP